RPAGRDIGGQPGLRDDALARVEGRSEGALALLGPLRVLPGGRQRGDREPVVDARRRVANPVPDAPEHLPVEVVPLAAAAGVARLVGRIVRRAVLAIGARIARVGGLRDLVVAGLWIRAVHDAEPAAVRNAPRADAGEERRR